MTTVEAQMSRSRKAPGPDHPLTSRQREVVQLIAEGRSAKDIAYILQISPRTAEFHRYRIMRTLGLHTIADVVQYALRHGITTQ